MSRVSDQGTPVQQGTADDWSSWTDDGTWELGPDPSEAGWWASQNAEADDDGPPPDDPLWDQWAEEAAQQDLMERGFRPF